jgi:Tfp pilus assembly protein PilX
MIKIHLDRPVAKRSLRLAAAAKRPFRSEEGNALVVAIFVVAILCIGLGTHLASLSNYRRLQEQRILDDRAMTAAEAGLASEIAWFESQPTPPSADVTQTISLPSGQFAPFQNVTTEIHVQTLNGQKYWTITATPSCDATATRNASVSRRVQATLCQQNFARYERFINDYGPVWTPGYLYGEGLNTVFMGPVNINSGCGFFTNFWSLSEVTSAAPGGVRTFADWGSYIAGVYGQPDSSNYVNVLDYMSPTYPNAPQFYGGLRMLPAPISLPTDMNIDVRAQQLRDHAGLTLPDNYPGYVASAGPNFVIDLSNPGSDGQITVRQYLGTVSGAPAYGPPKVTTVSSVNGAMIVKGNVVSLQGVLNGRLTIGVFASTDLPTGGNVNITGDVQYQSRMSNTGFEYTDAPGLYTADGSGINQSYVDQLQSQLNSVTDILGIVAEGNVLVKETDLNGNPIANDPTKPIYIDAVVMATGASASTPGGGGFGVEGNLTRPPGHAYFLGGMIENKQSDWALYNTSGILNGIALTQLWDERASEAGGAPPFFPTTGTFELVPNTWNATYVQSAAAPIVYPPLP